MDRRSIASANNKNNIQNQDRSITLQGPSAICLSPSFILVCRREVDHAHPPHPAVHHLHHGHGDPLRLLLGHQAAQGREGPRGRR